MSLKERLLEDLKLAMKDKNILKKNVVQMIRAGVLQVEKDNRITLDDDGVIDIIAKEIKKRKDVMPDYEKSGRQEMVDDLQTEINFLYSYMPEQLTEQELEIIVKETMEEVGVVSIKDMGKLMQSCMPKVKGRADGQAVNKAVRKLLM